MACSYSIVERIVSKWNRPRQTVLLPARKIWNSKWHRFVEEIAATRCRQIESMFSSHFAWQMKLEIVRWPNSDELVYLAMAAMYKCVIMNTSRQRHARSSSPPGMSSAARELGYTTKSYSTWWAVPFGISVNNVLRSKCHAEREQKRTRPGESSFWINKIFHFVCHVIHVRRP